MSRISQTFAKLQSEGQKALIPFVTAGFPYPDITPELMAGEVERIAKNYGIYASWLKPGAEEPR
jgi:tryptophan synthase alpha chain